MEQRHSAAYWRFEMRDLADIRVAKSWALVGGALLWAQLGTMALGGRRQRLDGVLTALVGTVTPFVTVLAHEGGHALVARALGWRRPVVVLDPFTATTNVADVPERPAQEAAFALAGVGANLLLAGIVGASAKRLSGTAMGRVLALGASLNLGLALVNAVPAPLLDGGLALRAGFWHRLQDRSLAARQSENVGGWVGLATLLVGIFGWRRSGPASDWRPWSGMLAVAGGFGLFARLVSGRSSSS